MRPWSDGEVRDVPGKPYKMKFIGGVYSCSCMAWRAQSLKIDLRTCKHLKKENGDAFEAARTAGKPVALPIAQTAGVGMPPEAAKPRGDTTLSKSGAIETYIECDKSKRINRHGGFEPFTEQEKAIVTEIEESRLNRKLRQDEKTDLFGPPILLANAVEDDLDPTGWLESEKLDGVRAYWNGEVFISRQGNVYCAPESHTAELPREPLDGELWIGRKQFQKTISVVKRQAPGPEWNQVRFVVFDAPTQAGSFEERLAHIFSLSLGRFAFGHPHAKCASRQEAEEHLKAAAAAGAEGLMYRKPGSKYEPRRSSTLLKLKPFQDAEAEVIAHKPGKGKHKGKLGGLTVRTPDGRVFDVGSGLTDQERLNPPKIGATITYRFADTTDDGLPKCASFVCTRDYEGVVF